MTATLPADIIERFGYLQDHQAHRNGEHSSACPQCGGARGGKNPSDRFRFWERPGQPCNFWCRRCGFQGFTDDNKPGRVMSEAEILELEAIRKRESERETRRLKARMEELQEAAYWRGWHDAMTEPHRAIWRHAGIPNSFQDYWQLGFTNYQGADFESPALTIPYFGPEWQALTIQYRLTNPPKPNDKYRFQAGLRSALWLSEPDEEIKNAVLLCEGMKKAAVSFIELVAKANHKITVTAVPSKAPGQDILSGFTNCDPLFICLDPDAYQGKTIHRLLKLLPDVPKRLVKLPVKADDFFTMHRGTAFDFWNYVEVARPV